MQMQLKIPCRLQSWSSRIHSNFDWIEFFTIKKWSCENIKSNMVSLKLNIGCGDSKMFIVWTLEVMMNYLVELYVHCYHGQLTSWFIKS